MLPTQHDRRIHVRRSGGVRRAVAALTNVILPPAGHREPIRQHGAGVGTAASTDPRRRDIRREQRAACGVSACCSPSQPGCRALHGGCRPSTRLRSPSSRDTNGRSPWRSTAPCRCRDSARGVERNGRVLCGRYDDPCRCCRAVDGRDAATGSAESRGRPRLDRSDSARGERRGCRAPGVRMVFLDSPLSDRALRRATRIPRSALP